MVLLPLGQVGRVPRSRQTEEVDKDKGTQSDEIQTLHCCLWIFRKIDFFDAHLFLPPRRFTVGGTFSFSSVLISEKALRSLILITFPINFSLFSAGLGFWFSASLTTVLSDVHLKMLKMEKQTRTGTARKPASASFSSCTVWIMLSRIPLLCKYYCLPFHEVWFGFQHNTIKEIQRVFNK